MKSDLSIRVLMMRRVIVLLFFAVAGAVFMSSCSGNGDQSKLFNLLDSEDTGIQFSNDLSFSQEFNIYRYRNFYNGGGVAIGDINNDGLVDLYFTSNMGKNRLYLNRGDLSFEDITDEAGVGGERAWSTGVSMADINGDGLIDIYVCNSGIVAGDDKRNELYINNGDSTFTERAAEYGLDDPALSIHASFFDYDRDGDLDMYLVNNSFRAIGSFDQEKNTRNRPDEAGGDKLYRNDGSTFTEVSREAGIYSSEIGFGLGASVGDVNRDGWEDIYVSNDFFERDYLYLNNKDGSFREVLEEQMKSISAAAMGADIGDLNGDGYPEIFVTDMLPKTESRLKQVTTFDSWERYRTYVKDGYYHQFTRNTLQMNNGNGTFSEVGRYAGVEATDWSWGANIADFDLDGKRDLFVANGIYQDLTNIDYLKHVSKEETVRKIVRDSTVDFKSLIEIIPSNPISNYAFRNEGNMRFADVSKEWGLGKPAFSNGSAYGDLDNDGDLDLVINNLNSEASVYENRATEKFNDRNWLKIKLEGTGGNPFAIGSQLTLWADGRQWYLEQVPVRGFQSTVDHRLHVGLGSTSMLDSLLIRWPDGKITKMENVSTNQMLNIKKSSADSLSGRSQSVKQQPSVIFREVTGDLGIEWKHKESSFVDFSRDALLFHMRSTEGPSLCVADADGDGLEDFYVGGARGQQGALFIQMASGKFDRRSLPVFEEDAQSEDVDCAWFDADGDGKQDLYVASGSNEFSPSSSALGDRLYLNQGKGEFAKADLGVPSWRYATAGSVSPADFDGDGDIDLFLGVRLQPFGIGIAPDSYLLENDGTGEFSDVTGEKAPALQKLGMVTDSRWADIDGDGDLDLMISGEWMPLTIFENRAGKLERIEHDASLADTHGWWNSLLADDIDGDGDIDIVAGNHGYNSRFRASPDYPVEMWVNDFDKNGEIEQIITTYKNGKAYPMALLHDLTGQLPYLENQYPDYASFAGKTINDIFTKEQLENSRHLQATKLGSIIAWNDGEGNFAIEELPQSAQLSPMYGLTALQLHGDERKEIVMGGNLYDVKPEVGRYDASYGAVIGFSDGIDSENDSLVTLSPERIRFSVEGQVRSIKTIQTRRYGKVLIVARNDDSIKLFAINPD